MRPARHPGSDPSEPSAVQGRRFRRGVGDEGPAASTSARSTAAPYIPRLLGFRLVPAVSVAVAQTAAHLANALIFDTRFDALNAGSAGEGNVFTWASSAATFTVAFVVPLLALTSERAQFQHAVLAAILAFFSLDDLVQIHEAFGTEVTESVLGLPHHLLLLIWPILYFPLLLTSVALLWRLARRAVPPVRRVIFGGLVLLGLAMTLEMATSFLRGRGIEAGDWRFELEVGIEEAFEIAGWIMIATGVTTFLVGHLARGSADDPSSIIPVGANGTGSRFGSDSNGGHTS